MTYTELVTALRYRLNDADSGAYSAAELSYCINLAYRETCAASKCHKISTDITLVGGTHSYDTGLFEPIEVSRSGNVLDRVNLGDMGVSLESWNATASGVPAKWMQLTGSTIRVNPTPSAGATLTVHGFGVPSADLTGSDTAEAIPTGYADTAVLDRAEAEARRMRVTLANNASVYAALMQLWQGWVQEIRSAVKG